jgi:hypothetical protein
MAAPQSGPSRAPGNRVDQSVRWHWLAPVDAAQHPKVERGRTSPGGCITQCGTPPFVPRTRRRQRSQVEHQLEPASVAAVGESGLLLGIREVGAGIVQHEEQRRGREDRVDNARDRRRLETRVASDDRVVRRRAHTGEVRAGAVRRWSVESAIAAIGCTAPTGRAHAGIFLLALSWSMLLRREGNNDAQPSPTVKTR